MTRAPWPRAVALGLAGSLLVTLLVVAFAWPAAKAAPHDVALGLVGPGTAQTQVEQALDAKAPDGFDVTSYADADAARHAVARHDVAGALVLAGGQPQLLVASAASPVVAQLLEEVADRAATALSGTPAAQPVAVTDVVPAPAGDARGSVMAAGMLPAVMGSIGVGVLVALVVRGRERRLVATGVASVGAGLLVALVLGPWFDALPGAYWAVAGVLALGVGAVAYAIVGLHALAGRPGLVLGAALILLVGNPASGAAAANEVLPTFWGAVGPYLPPGATVELLRSVTFFDGAHAAGPVLVLLVWFLAGAALVAVGRRGEVSESAGQPAVSTGTALAPAA